MGLAGSKSAGGRRFADRKDSTMAKKRLLEQHNRSADILKSRREALGLTVDDVADRMECARKTVLKYERDGIQSTTRFNRLMALVMVYEVSPDELIEAAFQEA